MSRTQNVTNSVNRISEQPAESLVEVRLAVTTDHCIWYVNPYTGQTDIVAGHPKLAGYCDDVEGLAARFSSPKGVVGVGSLLLVADYWNNAVRSINLFTSQVDSLLQKSHKYWISVIP